MNFAAFSTGDWLLAVGLFLFALLLSLKED